MTYNLNGLYCPIDLGYYFGEKQNFYIGTGAFAELFDMFKSTAKGEARSWNADHSTFVIEDGTANIGPDSFNWGLRVLFRVRIPFHNRYFIIKPVYSYSFLNLGNPNGYPGTKNIYMNTSNIQLNLGFNF